MGKVKTNVKHRFDIRFRNLVLGLFFLLSGITNYSQAAVIPLSLNDAIQRMIESNPMIRNLEIGLEQAQIQYDIAWYAFWLPNFEITANSTYRYSLGSSVPFSAARDDSSLKSKGPPSNTVTLGLGEIVIFDFFKQKANYDKAKLDYDRSKQLYQEQLRSQRFDLISIYFETRIAQEKKDAAERSLKISQAISELVESRKAIGKATEEELNSASVDLNNARIEFVQKKNELEQKLITLNTSLNTMPEIEYKLITELPFSTVRLDDRELFEIFKKMSPTSRQQEVYLAKAELDVANAEKSRLPLPKVSLSLFNISYSNGFAGGTRPSVNSNSNTNGSIDISTSINLSLPIFGQYGFFNDRVTKIQYLAREQQEINQHLTMMNSELDIKQKVINIRGLEQNIRTLKENLANNLKILDSFFKKAASGSVDRLQLRDAIVQARQSEFFYLENLFAHLRSKNDLAKTVGLDRLPGDLL